MLLSACAARGLAPAKQENAMIMFGGVDLGVLEKCFQSEFLEVVYCFTIEVVNQSCCLLLQIQVNNWLPNVLQLASSYERSDVLVPFVAMPL